jgi:hypothetical protein
VRWELSTEGTIVAGPCELILGLSSENTLNSFVDDCEVGLMEGRRNDAAINPIELLYLSDEQRSMVNHVTVRQTRHEGLMRQANVPRSGSKRPVVENVWLLSHKYTPPNDPVSKPAGTLFLISYVGMNVVLV